MTGGADPLLTANKPGKPVIACDIVRERSTNRFGLGGLNLG
jgi:hypothetical protein